MIKNFKLVEHPVFFIINIIFAAHYAKRQENSNCITRL